MTLRNRFAVLFIAFSVISVLAGGLGLARTTARQALEDALDRKLTIVAGLAAERIRADDVLLFQGRGDQSTEMWRNYHHELLRLVNDYVDDADVFAWRPGAAFAEALVTDALPDSTHPGQRLRWVELHLPVVERAYRDGQATTALLLADDGRYFKYGIVRLASDAAAEAGSTLDQPRAELRRAFLAVQMPADYTEPLKSLDRRIIAVSVVMSVLAGLVGWRIAGWIVARLAALSQAALRIQRGRMDQPIQVTGEDEISRLARAMERMRTGIRRRDEQLRLMPSRVAHEIRNPLGGLELFASAAQETDDPAERRRILDKVRKEIVGLNAIVEEFLGFARPSLGERHLHDVRGPVEEAAELTKAELAERGGRLHLAFPSQPLLALADPAQVKRLVLNLLRNASQAGDTVWVEGAMVRGEVRIAVRDNGPGIAPELRDRIFEPFVSDKEKGAGLGLAIVKDIAEACHGRVELAQPSPTDATPPTGAEFRVYLSGPESLPADEVSRNPNGEGWP